MSDGILQEIDAEHDQVLDVQRLIEAVRGSRAAEVLFDYRNGNDSTPASVPSLEASDFKVTFGVVAGVSLECRLAEQTEQL